MKLSTRLDVDLVALESSDELTLLVELTAPTLEKTTIRQPGTLQVVLDRSGSMAGDRLEGAKSALLSLVERLDPSDNLGIVAFDNRVEVVVPAGPLKDKQAVKQAIAAVRHGGSTDLSSGFLRGLQEARRVAGPGGGTVLIISDGHANAGITDPDQLEKVAVEAQTHLITTTTLGLGLGYDERLLSALARGGAGNELFAEEADTAIAMINGEVQGLLSQVAQAASLRFNWTRHVAGIQVLNDLPVASLEDSVMLELGSFYAGETRKLLVKLRIPGIAALGLTQVATLNVTHVSLPDLVQHTVDVPIHVNVVPGDQAAGRVPDPVVLSEALYQQTQQAKKESSRLLSEGRVGAASHLLKGTSAALRRRSATLPTALAADLNGEADLLDALDIEAHLDHSRAAKMSSSSATVSSRQRGRRNVGERLLLRWAVVPETGSAAVLVLEEREARQLRAPLPRELARAIRAGSNEVHDPQTANDIADRLGSDHPAYPFFTAAAAQGGFTVHAA